MIINNKTRVYIDGANLHFAIKHKDWVLSEKRFYVYLREKYKTEKIFLFLGYTKEQKKLYKKLEKIGFNLVFKQTLVSRGKIKGNCDAELVLKGTSDLYEKEFDKLVLVSSDGDFACFVKFALEKKKEIQIISPFKNLSYLIKKIQNIKIIFLFEIKELIKEKAPNEDETS